jgi:hypothetical protein
VDVAFNAKGLGITREGYSRERARRALANIEGFGSEGGET